MPRIMRRAIAITGTITAGATIFAEGPSDVPPLELPADPTADAEGVEEEAAALVAVFGIDA